MQYVKLQVGCLVLILYISVVYIRATINNTKCNKLFDALLIISPWAIAFDGLTAWTVNHLDIVPRYLNDIFHIIFFILMDSVVVITAIYLYQDLIGTTSEANKRRWHLAIPGAASLLLIIFSSPNIVYIEGVKTNYSMGIPVYVCYSSVVIHYGLILYLVISRRSFLAKEKRINIYSFIIIVGVALVAQIIFPEILITALFPTLLTIGIYVDFEDPSLKRLNVHNEQMVNSFAALVESRDNSTGGHVKRTREYVELILKKMKRDKKYINDLSKDYIEYVINASPLHDIGKIAIPDEILQKPGALTAEEYEKMKEHSAIGGDIIKTTFCEMEDEEFMDITYEVARFHHEKYNGKGYPDGLIGEEIPLHARIMAIADVFDAISRKRCYKEAFPVEKCFKIIEEGAGIDFDPDLVRIFLDSRNEVIDLMEKNYEAE